MNQDTNEESTTPSCSRTGEDATLFVKNGIKIEDDFEDEIKFEDIEQKDEPLELESEECKSLSRESTLKRPRPRRKVVIAEMEIQALLAEDSDSEDEISNVNLSIDESAEESSSSEDDDLETSDFNTNWLKVPVGKDNCPSFTLSGISDFSGAHEIVGFENLSPYDCFLKFFPKEILEITAMETNKYAKAYLEKQVNLKAKSRFRKWRDVTARDIQAFIAIEIAMGLLHKPTLQSYFDTTFFLTRTSGFGQVMSRDNYLLTKSFLHFSNNANVDKDDRLYKIRSLLNIVKGLYTQSYYPGREVRVDESMVKFKGRLFFKQYMPCKPSTKGGIQIWSLCDSQTGFLLKFDVYTGKEPEVKKGVGLGARVVHSLMEGFENKGHVVFLDNFYSSVTLYNELRLKQIGACGTIKANRKSDLPSLMSDKKSLKKGDFPFIWINDNKTMIACTWQDTGKVNMLATVGNTGVTPVQLNSKKGIRTVFKPNIQVYYNNSMGGVDLFDQLCSTYPYNRRSNKWYQTIWHFLIEVALVNGHICYNLQNKEKLTQSKFREKVIYGMLEGYESSRNQRKRQSGSEDTPLACRLTERHFPSHHIKSKPHCVVCSISKNKCAKQGEGECRPKQTTYFCAHCPQQPSLCIVPCFEVFHTKKKYKKMCRCLDINNI